MNKSSLFLALILLAGIGLAGCLGGPTPSAQPTGAGTIVPTATPAGGNTQTGSDLVGKGFEQLIALGAPVECKVNVKDSGFTQAATVKLKGQQFRLEGQTRDPSGTTFDIVMIKQADDTVYMRLPPTSQLPMPGGGTCEWLKIVPTDTTSTLPGEVADTESDLQKTPETDYSCSPGLFGDDIFVPSGTTCDLSAITRSVPTTTQSADGNPVVGIGGSVDASVCNSLPEPDKTECVNALSNAG